MRNTQFSIIVNCDNFNFMNFFAKTFYKYERLFLNILFVFLHLLKKLNTFLSMVILIFFIVTNLKVSENKLFDYAHKKVYIIS